MRNILNSIQNVIRQKKGLLIFLILFSIFLIVLGVIASINFSGGVLVVDLSNIAYIQFLKDDCSFFSLMFKLFLSLFIFMLIICLCGIKPYLFPLGLLFYGYLVYSQTVIFISMILIYGFFNCVIFALILLIYVLAIFTTFILLVVDVSCHCNSYGYFKTILNFKLANVLTCLILMLLATLIFCIVLVIMKSFVLLLVY